MSKAAGTIEVGAHQQRLATVSHTEEAFRPAAAPGSPPRSRREGSADQPSWFADAQSTRGRPHALPSKTLSWLPFAAVVV